MMDENFIKKISEARKQAISQYLINNSYELLKKIDTYTSILAMSKLEAQIGVTTDLTREMQEQMKNVDFSKIDIDKLMKQMG